MSKEEEQKKLRELLMKLYNDEILAAIIQLEEILE
jgi:hypothetical protein